MPLKKCISSLSATAEKWYTQHSINSSNKQYFNVNSEAQIIFIGTVWLLVFWGTKVHNVSLSETQFKSIFLEQLEHLKIVAIRYSRTAACNTTMATIEISELLQCMVDKTIFIFWVDYLPTLNSLHVTAELILFLIYFRC